MAITYNTSRQSKILNIVIESDNKGGEGCVQRNR